MAYLNLKKKKSNLTISTSQHSFPLKLCSWPKLKEQISNK